MPREVLVVGATGTLGGMISRRLLDQRRAVRILARGGSAYQPLEDAGAEVAKGDLKQRSSLDEACKGVSTVVTTANSALRGPPDTVESVDLAGNRNLIDAARGAGVRQFVFVSALGADPQSPVPFMQAKARTEAYLKESGIPYTIVSPNLYMEVWIGMVVSAALQAGRAVTLVGEGRRRHSFISMQDVAKFVTASIDNPAAMNRQLVLGGPQAVSWREILATFERVRGARVTSHWVAPGTEIAGLPPVMVAMLGTLETYDSPVESDKLAKEYAVSLTSVEQFARSAAPPGGK